MTTIDQRFQSNLAPDLLTRLLQGNQPRIAEGGLLYTGAVRLSWPSLAKPQLAKNPKPGDKPKYQASGIFVHKNIGVIMEALKAAVRRDYPNVTDPMVLLDPKNKNSAVKDQALKVSVNDGGLDPINATTAGYVPGFPFVSGKSEKAVPCFHRKDGRVVALLPEEIEKLLYAGAWVDIKYKIIKSTSTGNPGEFFGLQSVMKLGDDTSFGSGGGGGGSPEDWGDSVAIEDPNANQIMQNSGVTQNDWDSPSSTTTASATSEWE
jgi:Protein of unknown function (DUF2815)